MKVPTADCRVSTLISEDKPDNVRQIPCLSLFALTVER